MSFPTSTARTTSVRRLLARSQSRTLFSFLAVALLLLAAVLVLAREIEHHLLALESWIERLGPWGILAFVFLFALAMSLLLPESVMCIAAGALFGLARGVAAVMAGSLLGAALQYALSRRLLRARIERSLAARESLAAIQRAVLHDEIRLQLLLRLTPLNPATVNYLLGAAGVRFSGFLVGCLAMIPSLFLEVYLGHAGKHLARLAGGNARTTILHDVTILVGFAVALVVTIFVSRQARKAVIQAASDTEEARPDGDLA